jgi:hypothetical protein
MAETGRIRKIAFAVASSAPPALPNLGGAITYATPWLTVLGGQPEDVATDDGYIDKHSVTVTPRIERYIEKPPLAQNKIDAKMIKNAADKVTFSLYSATRAILLLSSTSAQTAGPPVSTQEGVTITYRAMIIEIEGLKVLYFPKVRVRITHQGGGIKEHYSFKLEAKVFGTTGAGGIPSGMRELTFTTPA